MKFYCDSCGAKYAIADEKVRGKILKVRCKKCTHVISVREPNTPVTASAPMASSTQAPVAPALAGRLTPSVPWYYAINGQSFGPFEQAVMMNMYQRGEVGDASYVWNETFTSWKPVFEVEPFASALRAAQAMRPVAKTIGVSGALEAIKIPEHQPPQEEEEGQVPDIAAAAETSAPAKPANPFAASDKNAELSGRLGQLRDQLNKVSPTPAAAASVKTPDQLDADDDLLDDEDEDSDATRQDLFVQPDPFAAAGLKVAPASSPFTTQPVEDEAVVDEDFNPDAPARDPFKSDNHGFALGAASAGVHDDLFSEIHASDEASIDFSALESKDPFAESPFTPSKKDETFEASNSLLIQLDQIKKQGRGKRWIIGAVSAAVLLGVLGGGIVLWQQNKNVKLTVESTGMESTHKDDLAIPKYTSDELTFFHFDEKEETINVEEPDEAPSENPTAQAASTKPSTNPTSTRPKPVELAHNDVKTKPNLGITMPVIERGSDKFENAFKNAKAQGAQGSDAGLSTSSKDPAKAAEIGKLDGPPRIKGVTPPPMNLGATSRQPIFKRPEDSIESNGPSKNAALPAGGLTKEELKEGFVKIRKSVSSCYQHHVRRGLPFDSPKIKVQVEIQGSGRVGSVKFDQPNLDISEFGRCMESRRSTWTFREYGGKPIKVEHTYVLQ